jgi:acyl-coenzyme A thioesterase PaaI-like protein
MLPPLSTTLSLEQLRARYADFEQLEFMQLFGARMEIVDMEHVRVSIDPLKPAHRGGIQGTAVNGGVLAAMFDLALGMPGLLRTHPEGKRSATIQISMSFMRALKGDMMLTEAWIERAGAGLLFTRAEARDAKGTVCATAQGVVRVMDGYSEPITY